MHPPVALARGRPHFADETAGASVLFRKMCRLFGFRSQSPSAVHRSLVGASNALRVQSRAHPDGWGIGWWSEEGPPQLVRSAGAAHAEPEFVRSAEQVRATSVIAHIRKASVGPVRLDNAHPFRWGPWLFAHNGTVAHFDRHRGAIERAIDPAFANVVVGDTDSARCFGLFLTRLSRLADPSGNVAMDALARALGETVHAIAAITDADAEVPSATTFLVGNGRLMLACRRGRTLWYAPHGGTSANDAVDRLIIASEHVCPSEPWIEVPHDGMIGVDGDLRLHRYHLADWQQRRSA